MSLIQHLTMHEIGEGPEPERAIVRKLFVSRNVPVLDFGTSLTQALEEGEYPFRDNIHISGGGQPRPALTLPRSWQKG